MLRWRSRQAFRNFQQVRFTSSSRWSFYSRFRWWALKVDSRLQERHIQWRNEGFKVLTNFNECVGLTIFSPVSMIWFWFELSWAIVINPISSNRLALIIRLIIRSSHRSNHYYFIKPEINSTTSNFSDKSQRQLNELNLIRRLFAQRLHRDNLLNWWLIHTLRLRPHSD